jgi:hypothetical protein
MSDATEPSEQFRTVAGQVLSGNALDSQRQLTYPRPPRPAVQQDAETPGWEVPPPVAPATGTRCGSHDAHVFRRFRHGGAGGR